MVFSGNGEGGLRWRFVGQKLIDCLVMDVDEVMKDDEMEEGIYDEMQEQYIDGWVSA